MMPLSDIFAAFRWWLVLLVLGTAVTPLAHTLFHRLPDRGYTFTKMLGLLLVSYLFWLLGSLGFVGNNVGGILLAVGLTTAVSLTLYRHSGHSLRDWLSTNWRQVLLTELVFAAIFALWVWVRAQNPAITATEKPMEFAFLNAVGRSATFPPLDPWLSGFAISYYYFGYVMTSVLARLSVVAEPIAFNLGIAWLVAGTATGAFGLVYNLVAIGKEKGRQTAVFLGLLAALAIPIAGNQQITLETAYANNIGSDTFWSWLDIRDINTPPTIDAPARYESTSWWWWRSSRVIHEYHLSGRAEEGLEPIAEFPGFSFILGDMHPHVLALPFALLSLAIALLWYLDQRHKPPAPAGLVANLRATIATPLFWLTALMLGGLSFLNTWDVLIHLFVIVGAFLLGRWQASGWRSTLLNDSLLFAVALVIPAALLYLPFYLGFSSQAGPPYILPMLMRPTRLAHFLVIFAMPLLPIVLLLASLLAKQRLHHWRLGLTTAVAIPLALSLLLLLFGWIVAASADGAGRVLALAQELNLALPPRPETGIAAGWGVTAVAAITPTLLQTRLAYPGMVLLLATILGSIVMVWRERNQPEPEPAAETAVPSPFTTLPFVLLLVFTAALLTLGPEFVYLRDNFGQRLNTIFKFYYQAWVMFGIAGLVAIDLLWREVRRPAARAVPALATGGYVALLLLALQFPFYGVQSRAREYRGAPEALTRQPATLNGLAYMAQFNPDEYAAIQWLRQYDGIPIVAEAVGGQYSQYGRISASTGLPTLLGWAGHEYQWRGPSTPEPGRRDPAVRDIYTQPNWDATTALLNEYNVNYIYVGPLERSTYGPIALEKFNGRLDIAYQNNSVTIFRWPHGE